MIRTLLLFALLSLLSACVPMPIQQEAGLRGHVLDVTTYKPIANARICIHETELRCVFSNAEGKFDLKPIFKDRWQFIMIEPLVFPKGRFTVDADGYREQTIVDGHSRVITVELTSSR